MKKFIYNVAILLRTGFISPFLVVYPHYFSFQMGAFGSILFAKNSFNLKQVGPVLIQFGR